MRLIALALAVGLVGCTLSSAQVPSSLLTRSYAPQPALVIDESVDGDFRAIAQTTWQKFLTTFRGRTNCFGDVQLRAAYDLDSRAAYDPKTATVTVRVPGSAVMLSSALIHEWAHHVEFQCPAHKSFRSEFLAAQGIPQDTPWRPNNAPAHLPESAWADIPSEQYAEAAIQVVLGRRQIPTTARVTNDAARVLARWAAGEE